MSRITSRVRPLTATAVLAPLAIAGGVAAGLTWLPPDLARLNDVSARVVDRDGKLLRAFTSRDGTWRLPARPKDVSPLFLRMLIAYEDQRFYKHAGTDPQALVRALWQRFRYGRVISGGSTLTMQAVRLLEPRGRSLGAKLIEVLRAHQLETQFNKSSILSAYLTLAPYGANLEGIRAASLAWFGREPLHLTAGQAALLVALPQAPSRIRPDRYPERARAARNKILRMMIRRGVLTAPDAQAAMKEALPTRRRAMPFRAPHLARRLRQKAPGKKIYKTLLVSRLQLAAEEMLKRETKLLDRRATVAALIVENKTGAVVAYVGSANFGDQKRLGHVDMIRAIRSPGSTLKPFIYGMGFDMRLVHPDTVVVDTPTRFGQYRPENFLRSYHGEVSIRYALQHSLNVPAVAVLEGVGPVRLAAALKAAGAGLHFPASTKQPGLPIALGGAGTSLRALVRLYAGLANGGMVQPIRLQPSAKPRTGNRIISAGAAWHLARILENAPPPNRYVAARNASGGRPIAYKTGTSYGFRDAWAIGYDGTHTIGIWVGRADGTPSPGRYGRKTAAPILFKAFDLIPRAMTRGTAAMWDRPIDVVTVATNRDLPANLRRYTTGVRTTLLASKSITKSTRKPLMITFPVNGSVMDFERRQKGGMLLPLTAEGGRKPLRWLVNGQPIAASRWTRQAMWKVDGEGFVKVTVIDAEGRSATAHARLR